MQKSKYFKGFTLVELIIVITILAILGSIAFVSFGVYSKNARDSNRLSTMSTIEKGISLNQATTDKSILPDDYTEVSASGNLMGYEGIVGENVGRIIGLNSIPKDPKTRENYIYYTNKDRNKVQIMGFLEGEEMTYLGLNKAQAAGSGTKIPKVTGDNLGIILDSNYNRVTGTGIDILLTNSGTIYTTYFSNTDTVTGSGKDLYSKIYNRRSDLLNDKSLASLDDSLVGYWDMETLTGGKLKDFSKNNYDGILPSGITIGGAEGINGKGTYFYGSGKTIYMSSIHNSLNSSQFTISAWIKLDGIPENSSSPLYQSYIIAGSDYTFNGGYLQIYRNSICGGNIRIVYWLNLSSAESINSIDNCNNLDTWYHILGVFDKDEQIIYLNGVKNNSYDRTGKNMIIGSQPFFIGGDAPHAFKGIIDEVRIYNRSLSSTEISELYKGTLIK